jgi:hypothetical protein
MLVRPFDQPWETNYQRQADDAFARANELTDEQLRDLGPPLPQIVYLPPRFGYPPYAERQWTVMDVFGITRTWSGAIPGFPRLHGKDRVDFSRSQSSDQGSERNSNSGDPLGLGGVSW